MICRNLLLVATAPSTWAVICARLWHAEVLKRIGHRAGDLCKVSSMLDRRRISALMALVVASRCCFARIVCCSTSDVSSLFSSCNVRGSNTCGVDLVEDRDFGIQVRVGRERVLFEVCNLRLHTLRVTSN